MSTERLIPELRFPEFVNLWSRKKLSDYITSLDSGVSVNSSDEPAKEDEFGILKTSSAYGGNFRPDENKAIVEAEVNRARLNPKKDSILISRMNTPELVGELGYVDNDYPNLFVPDRLWMTSTNDQVDVKWLTYLLVTPGMRSMISSIGTGTSGSMKNISKPNFLGLDITSPNLSEQQKIASFLTAVDKRIQLQQQKKAQLERYKKGVMQKLFSREIRFKDEDGNDFPDWEFKKAKHVFRNHSNKNHDGDLPILSASQEYGMIYRDDSGIKIQSSEKSVKSYKIVEPNDFVISLRSFQGGLDFSELLGICSPAYTILKNSIQVNYQFYKFYFKKESFIEQLSKTVVGIRDGKQITYENFGTLTIPYPSVREQERISEFLNTLDSSLAALDQQIKVTQEFKKGLLQKMFV